MGQRVSSNLPQQSVQHKNDLFKSDSTHLPDSTIALQIIPPEFTQLDDTSIAVFSPDYSNYNFKKTLSSILAKVVSNKVLSDLKPNELSASILVAQSEVIADADNNVITAINPKISTNRLPTVEFGDSGLSVRVVQRLLASSGYSMEVDGFFGALTEVAVKAFQNQRNLVVDGIVGQNTWRELTR
ncbi:peptidoglycan binding domain-containing protein [Calothrix sp. NIES-4071]|nr:peptidoglycan binding domain-containing protein [Calothrix sp. NIES-4071]